VGVPKTIDGDLKTEQVEASFGFDTASKMYAELVGNIARDAKSARKYWHFIKLMGRSASHITLEVALQTRPNLTLISEEILANNVTLDKLVEDICEIIIARHKASMSFGVVLVPEGLIEFIPEMRKLIAELNTLLADNEDYFKSLHTFEQQSQYINHHLSAESSHVFSSLPADIQYQMLSDRDDHGNLSVSSIETDKLLVELCDTRLSELRARGEYTGKFSAQHHFLGYEGRCAPPTNFDSNYTYNLGYAAYHLLNNGVNGYMVTVNQTWKPHEDWVAGGIPLTMLMNMEERKGHLKPVIQKALVELDSKPFLQLAGNRKAWALHENYRFPGPIQYFGSEAVCNQPSVTMKLERG